MGWGPNLQEEVPHAKQPEARGRGGQQLQEDRLAVLPAEDGALPNGAVLNWTKNRPTPQCWWCRYRTQTRDHPFKECAEWKPQQKIL